MTTSSRGCGITVTCQNRADLFRLADPTDRRQVVHLRHGRRIKAWWYPGERSGYGFMYPKDQARELAKEVTEPILTTKAETTKPEEVKTAELERITPKGEEIAVVPQPELIVPSGIVQEGTLAEARTELPVTATRIPTFAFAGILALALAGGLRLWRAAH